MIHADSNALHTWPLLILTQGCARSCTICLGFTDTYTRQFLNIVCKNTVEEFLPVFRLLNALVYVFSTSRNRGFIIYRIYLFTEWALWYSNNGREQLRRLSYWVRIRTLFLYIRQYLIPTVRSQPITPNWKLHGGVLLMSCQWVPRAWKSKYKFPLFVL